MIYSLQLFPITIICLIIWGLVISSCIYSAVFEKNYLNGNSLRDGYPPIRWTKIEDCDRAQVGTMFFPIALETIHLPIHIYLSATNRLHPITALVLSIFLFINWVTLPSLGMAADWCAEQSFPVTWEGLFWARQALGYVLAVIYLVYMGRAAVAVHCWRKARKSAIRDSDTFIMLRKNRRGSIEAVKTESSQDSVTVAPEVSDGQ